VNGYIEGGYSICLATLAIYAATRVRRERSLRRRLPEGPGGPVSAGPDGSGANGAGPRTADPDDRGPDDRGPGGAVPAGPTVAGGARDGAGASVGGP
jgi:hypothetical protein